jgi:hypothetical protein
MGIWAGTLFGQSMAMHFAHTELLHGTLHNNQHLLPVPLSIFDSEQVFALCFWLKTTDQKHYFILSKILKNAWGVYQTVGLWSRYNSNFDFSFGFGINSFFGSF